ncbi:MAG: PRC-barrel domain-containing protein [Oculatellaceae cyanobacterium bins.114]|nr:PRC-barrel domain-containing protein [Oculatellaceae cyanobacterium bins.114]
MTSERFLQRSDLLGTQVITRDRGKRLGVVSQVWVDVDRREVVAFGMRESMLSGVLSGIQQIMLLDSIREIGDVILVDDDTVVEDDFNVDIYSGLVGSEVITETGELLGKVRGFKFDADDGGLESITIASLGLPQIPDQLISTYELSIDEVVSSGPDRLIVFEGAEQKLRQLTVGVLERVGIGKPPWDRDEDEEYIMPTSVSNQLGTGLRTSANQSTRNAAPASRETWDDDNWSDAQPRRQIEREPLRQRQPEPTYYDDDDNNWNDSPEEEYEYEELRQEQTYEPKYAKQYDEVLEDAWGDDDNPKPYRGPQVNIPERKKVVEYEEETDY